jgi:hypothetical protein
MTELSKALHNTDSNTVLPPDIPLPLRIVYILTELHVLRVGAKRVTSFLDLGILHLVSGAHPIIHNNTILVPCTP